MKSILVVFLLFSLLLVTNLSCATKENMVEYWKNMMKGEAMPEAIKGLNSGSTSNICREWTLM
ncbi:putative organ specific protein [Medicago truncatula]|uniref:Putative organ specific protein n=1 Tax=Medicago truncatula TaxID=3880 RepID=A0A072V2Z7_MEDTR|nr:transmembrane protein, putative [Medicago truncatula]RHN71275.1 putative organ specific protein [Medicago truncatula]